MIIVRRATTDDLESLVATYTAAWREGFADMFSVTTFLDEQFDVDRRYEVNELLLDDTVTTTVAEASGRVIAFSGVSIDDGVPVLDDMWIHPHAWGSGAAQALLSAFEDEQRSKGVTRITTWVPEDSPRARGLMAKTGWNPTGAAEKMGVYPNEPNLLFEYDRHLV